LKTAEINNAKKAGLSQISWRFNYNQVLVLNRVLPAKPKAFKFHPLPDDFTANNSQ